MKTLLELAVLADQLRAAIAEMIADAETPTPGPIDPPPAPAKPIAQVVIENLGGDQTNVPVTFGHVFAPGDLPAGMGLRFAQLDVKATHPDGSVRHAVVSTVLSGLMAGEKRPFALIPEKPVTYETPARKRFDLCEVLLVLGGRAYRAVSKGAGDIWLYGPFVTEIAEIQPFQDENGQPHPHLSARFATRCHDGERTRVDVTIENAWAYEPDPQNFTYDVEIVVAGQKVYEQKGLTHYHHARWRKVFWTGEAPAAHVRHDIAYLIDSRAVPNYDRSIAFGKAALSDLATRWAKAQKGPMDTGLAMRAMPTTGGRPDIGLMPSWAATYLLTMDAAAKEATLGTGDLAGSYSMHYRDKNTGQPVSLIDYPYMTLLGNPGDTKNPATGKREAFPVRLVNPTDKMLNAADVSHHPALSYLPYLVTGDLYHLEELQFWAAFCAFNSNPGYRQNVKGLLKSDQVRGQAWALRTLAEAAYITPDADRLKQHFLDILDANLDWYLAEYPKNPEANKLGFIANGYAMAYNGGRGLAPWQDDFFTQAVGHALELGFKKAETLLAWKVRFPVERMVGEGACWIGAAMYEMAVRDDPKGPFYDTIGRAFSASNPLFAQHPCGGTQMAAALKLKVGEMTGYSSSPTGYPSNMQPALAFAADFGGEDGKRAWEVFMARSVKPDYSLGPQFAIVPRTL